MIFSGLVFSSSVILYNIPISSDIVRNFEIVENVEAVKIQESIVYGLPVHINIPKINVSSSFEYVGFANDGTMGIPKSDLNVAWFELGVRPGEIGSAVIDGHLDKKNGKPAVFNKLSKLRKGDKIYVTDENNQIITFIVRESKKYDYKADSTNIFVSNDGISHLNLITCGGSWSKVSKIYSKRLIVFADKE